MNEFTCWFQLNPIKVISKWFRLNPIHYINTALLFQDRLLPFSPEFVHWCTSHLNIFIFFSPQIYLSTWNDSWNNVILIENSFYNYYCIVGKHLWKLPTNREWHKAPIWRACFQNLLHPLWHVTHLHYWLPFAKIVQVS